MTRDTLVRVILPIVCVEDSGFVLSGSTIPIFGEGSGIMETVA